MKKPPKKQRLSVYLDPDVMKNLADYAARRDHSRSLIAEAAIASFLSPDAAERQEAATTRRLDQLDRRMTRMERDLGIAVASRGIVDDLSIAANVFLGDWPRSLYAAANFVARRYAAAAAVIKELHTPQVSACRWFAAIHAALGDAVEAGRYARRYLDHYPDFDLDDHIARMPFRHPEDRDHYAHWLREAGFERAERSCEPA